MKAFCMIASIWFIVFVFAIMPILGWNEYVYVDDRKHCMIYWQRGGTDSAYGVFLSISSFVIPTWIMLLCYVKIFSTARKQAKKVAQSRGWNMAASGNKVVPSDYDESDTTRGVLAFPYRNMNNLTLESIKSVGPNTEDFEEKDPEKQVVSFDQQRNHSLNNSELFTGKDKNSVLTKAVSRDLKERRTARVILIVIGVFQICWLPYAALNQWSAFTRTTPPGVADLGASLLAYFNSGCNAIIYTKFNPNFRKAFAKLLLCGCLKDTKNKPTQAKRIQVDCKK